MKTITLNGLTWDTENLVIDGRTHFSYDDAKAEAAKLGKRLPTSAELAKLLQLPCTLDTVKRGIWFAEKAEDLKTEKSLFLPVSGYRYDNSSKCWAKFSAYYWSSTTYNMNLAYYYRFDTTKADDKAYISTYYRTYNFSVRCVAD
jgi:uncharacterized protein (TIGR02145 family)